LTILDARVPLVHLLSSINEPAGHLLSLRDYFLQHWSSARRSLLKVVPLFLIQKSWQEGMVERSSFLSPTHFSFMPNIIDSHPAVQQSLSMKPHILPPTLVQSSPSRKWDWDWRWEVLRVVKARVAIRRQERTMGLIIMNGNLKLITNGSEWD
jgi:hypothetical protein